MIRNATVVTALCVVVSAACSKEPPAASEPTTTSAFAATKEAPAMTLFDQPIAKLGSSEPTTLAEHKGKALLIVNVASQCGLTPQYEGLEALQKEYGPRGFTVLGFPCNQFGGQEPGSAEEIQTFCTSNYGVSFPMYEKIEVNGAGRHPIYQQLTTVADGSGEAGDVKWNFEKFFVSADGQTVVRFRPQTTPQDPAIVAAIEAGLP